MKRPSFQWYPGDFRRDTAVQACCFGARSLWREMMDLMHDGEPYGHLTAGGVAIQPENLARIVGEPAGKVRRWLKELDDHKVFSRTDAGVIFSRRMVRDELHRNRRGAGGIKSLDNPNVPRPKDRSEDTAKDGGKDTFRPSSDTSSGGSPAVASAVAVARKTKTKSAAGAANRGLELLPKADCDAAFTKWGECFGAYDYGRFRLQLLNAYQPGQPQYPISDVVGAIEAAREWWIEQDDRDQGFFTLEKFIAQLAKWVAFGKMPLTERGELTERGAWAGSKAIREASRRPRMTA